MGARLVACGVSKGGPRARRRSLARCCGARGASSAHPPHGTAAVGARGGGGGGDHGGRRQQARRAVNVARAGAARMVVPVSTTEVDVNIISMIISRGSERRRALSWRAGGGGAPSSSPPKRPEAIPEGGDSSSWSSGGLDRPDDRAAAAEQQSMTVVMCLASSRRRPCGRHSGQGADLRLGGPGGADDELLLGSSVLLGGRRHHFWLHRGAGCSRVLAHAEVCSDRLRTCERRSCAKGIAAARSPHVVGRFSRRDIRGTGCESAFSVRRQDAARESLWLGRRRSRVHPVEKA